MEFRSQNIAAWYYYACLLLEKYYGNIQVCSKFTWVMVDNFRLPPNFNQTYTPLLITTPGEYLTSPDGFKFYMDRRLYRTDIYHTDRFFDDHSFNELRDKGWNKFCLHVKQLKPIIPDVQRIYSTYGAGTKRAKNVICSMILEGDNLITVVKTLYNFIGDKEGIK
jgi:hypothetical protein